jgi:outer membrane protein TolC
VSVLEFRRTLEETLGELEQAYWQQAQAVEQVAIQEELLSNTLETYRVLKERQEQGVDVTLVEVSQAQASVESRRAELVRARARVKDLSDELKRRMNDPDLPVSDPTIVMPGTAPLLEPVNFNLSEQVNTALENRLELGQQQLRIGSAGIAAGVAANNLLPQLNLVGQVSFQGPGEDIPEGNEAMVRADFVNYAIGLQFEVPLGNRQARAIWRRALLQRAQAIEQYRNLVNQVTLDVTTGWREVDTTWDEIITRRQARFAAAEALRAIYIQREGAEAFNPSFVRLVLDTEERLANAQLEEAQSIAAYNIAISRLERAKGTLLRYNNVLMEEGEYLGRNVK